MKEDMFYVIIDRGDRDITSDEPPLELDKDAAIKDLTQKAGFPAASVIHLKNSESDGNEGWCSVYSGGDVGTKLLNLGFTLGALNYVKVSAMQVENSSSSSNNSNNNDIAIAIAINNSINNNNNNNDMCVETSEESKTNANSGLQLTQENFYDNNNNSNDIQKSNEGEVNNNNTNVTTVNPPVPQTPPPPPPPVSNNNNNNVNKANRPRSPSPSSSSRPYVKPYYPRGESGYVGLKNQGATCYLNSFIQTLFMTPEFRREIYAWPLETYLDTAIEAIQAKKMKRSGTPPPQQQQQQQQPSPLQSPSPSQSPTEDNNNNNNNYSKSKNSCSAKVMRERLCNESVVYALQTLFVKLQKAKTRAVSTKRLTASFGWTREEAYVQHDVNEMCLELFRIIEKEVRGLPQDGMIQRLFEGSEIGYVKCLKCGTVHRTEAKFFDIDLPVQPFGAPRAVASLEEALTSLTRPERLTDSNQYNCDVCKSPQDADKGTAFDKLPYILKIQLKRWTFDYSASTLGYTKYCGSVSFPEILDMAPYMSKDVFASSTASSSSNSSNNNNSIDGNDDVTQQQQKQQQKKSLKRSGTTTSMIYTLYSVLVHSGGSSGGHYYAYIRNFDTGKWFEFNDSTVRPVSWETVTSSFGDKDSSRAYGSTAYMLVYRLDDRRKNQSYPDIPQSYNEYVKKKLAREEEKAIAWEKEKKDHPQKQWGNSDEGEAWNRSHARAQDKMSPCRRDDDDDDDNNNNCCDGHDERNAKKKKMMREETPEEKAAREKKEAEKRELCRKKEEEERERKLTKPIKFFYRGFNFTKTLNVEKILVSEAVKTALELFDTEKCYTDKDVHLYRAGSGMNRIGKYPMDPTKTLKEEGLGDTYITIEVELNDGTVEWSITGMDRMYFRYSTCTGAEGEEPPVWKRKDIWLPKNYSCEELYAEASKVMEVPPEKICIGFKRYSFEVIPRTGSKPYIPQDQKLVADMEPTEPAKKYGTKKMEMPPLLSAYLCELENMAPFKVVRKDKPEALPIIFEYDLRKPFEFFYDHLSELTKIPTAELEISYKHYKTDSFNPECPLSEYFNHNTLCIITVSCGHPKHYGEYICPLAIVEANAQATIVIDNNFCFQERTTGANLRKAIWEKYGKEMNIPEDEMLLSIRSWYGGRYDDIEAYLIPSMPVCNSYGKSKTRQIGLCVERSSVVLEKKTQIVVYCACLESGVLGPLTHIVVDKSQTIDSLRETIATSSGAEKEQVVLEVKSSSMLKYRSKNEHFNLENPNVACTDENPTALLGSVFPEIKAGSVIVYLIMTPEAVVEQKAFAEKEKANVEREKARKEAKEAAAAAAATATATASQATKADADGNSAESVASVQQKNNDSNKASSGGDNNSSEEEKKRNENVANSKKGSNNGGSKYNIQRRPRVSGFKIHRFEDEI